MQRGRVSKKPVRVVQTCARGTLFQRAAKGGENNPMWGKSHKYATRRKISESMKGVKQSEYQKYIASIVAKTRYAVRQGNASRWPLVSSKSQDAKSQ